MVVQRQQPIRSRFFSNSPDQCYFKQEIECIRKSIVLDPINMVEINPSIISTFLYPLILTLSVFLSTFFISLIKSSQTLNLMGIGIVYAGFLLYSYCGGLSYRMFLNKETDTKFLSYVYVCMYSMTYYPIALFLTLIIGPVGSIIMFALVLLTQYILMTTLCFGYDFPTMTKRFLFSLLILVIQFIFVVGLESLIVDQIKSVNV